MGDFDALDAVIQAIRANVSVGVSPEVEALIQKALTVRAPEDIDAWARRLAADVADLND